MIPQQLCTWGVAYSDVLAGCRNAPPIDDAETPAQGTVTTAQATLAVRAAEEAIFQATGGRFSVCTRVARPCGCSGCGGSCGAYACVTGRYDRIDLDPHDRSPVVDVLAVTEGATALTVDQYAVQDNRWLLRLPVGTRWPARRTDIAADEPDLEVVWTHGTAPPADLLLNGVVPLACDLARKLAGLECAIPDRVVSVTTEGSQFVMTDLTSMVERGLAGPVSTLAAVQRAHPHGAQVSSPAGIFNPATAATTTEVRGGPALLPAMDEFDRVQGDAWTWEWETDSDLSDWLNLEVFIRDAPSSSGTLLASTDDTIVTTGTDFAGDPAVVKWTVPSLTTTGIDPGVVWIEASADVPAEGGAYTFMPARRLIVRPQVAT